MVALHHRAVIRAFLPFHLIIIFRYFFQPNHVENTKNTYLCHDTNHIQTRKLWR